MSRFEGFMRAVRGPRVFPYRTLLLASLLLITENAAGQQDSPRSSPIRVPAKTASTSLRICLRLQNESPFIGSANVRVMPSEGYEIGGTVETEGETLFSDVPQGAYTIETSAPGFLTVRQKIQIEPGQHALTRFVIMKPKPLRLRLSGELAAAPSPVVAAPKQASWIPAGIDDAVPALDPSVQCPLAHVLNGAGQRMQQFVGNLEKFTATERVEHFAVDVTGVRGSAQVRSFPYVVMVSQSSTGVFMLEEYRNGSVDPAQFPANIATEGMPALALVFHPLMVPDFRFECEGLGEWEGQAAWQVHFVQRPDRPGRLIAYSAGGKYSLLALKGRVWVDPGTFQVLRLESELVQPVKEMALTQQRIAISYQPVPFRTQDQELWLPRNAEIYVERQGRRYYRRHTFSDFKLFTVQTTQDIQLAKESYGFTNQSDRDITGVLIVTPISEAGLDPVSVSFTIPAGGSIVKLVGSGKEVAIPVESVGSATFTHNGPQDAIRVDARLSKASTLDVISGVSVPLKP